MTTPNARQVVSFLFCDQVGSTALLEQLGEAANDEFRRDLFATLRRPIEVFGGIEVKSQGDGLMVAFPSGPTDAVSCAVAMQRAADALAGRDRRVPVAIRAGVATGEVTVEDDDYFGRPVVEAARLCGAAQPGQVLATATVVALVEPDLAARATAVGGLLLKGLTDPLPSVSFDWANVDHTSSGPIAVPPLLDPTGLLPFVGRAEEQSAFDEVWSMVDAGRAGVITVAGPAGTGKSRLVAVAARSLASRHHLVALAGSARSDPLADALRWWARASSAEVVRSTLGPLAPAVAARIPAVALQLSTLAPLDQVDVVTAESTGEVDLDHLVGSERPVDPIVAGLVAVAARTPVVLLIDDAEMSTPATAEDLATLLELAPGGMMLVVAFREAVSGSPLVDVLAKIAGLAHSRSLVLAAWEPEQTVEAVTSLIPGLDRPDALALHEAAHGNPARVSELAAAARSGGTIDEVVASVQPFKGLVPYGTGDGEVFFGRDDDIAALLGKLASTRLLTVTGPSGAGKSSLVLAGLVPAIARGALPGSESWPLAIVEASRDDPQAVARALDGLPAEGGMLVVDQAEELLPSSAVDPRHRVVDQLLAAIADPGRSVRAILALRADRYGDLTVHPALAAAVERDHVLVGPMRPDQLMGVVSGPAQQAGLRVESGLAELVVTDAAAEPGALPLVSHALRETWRRRRGSTLTIADYREAGGVRGAIAFTADDLVRGLDADGQRLLRLLFIELAEVTHTGEPARRRLARATIADLLSATTAEVDAVLGRAIDARLVVSDGEHVQISHEALLREWPRLRGWLEEDRDRIRRRRAVAEQAAEWDVGGRQPSDLLGGGRLELARDDLAAGTEGWTNLVQEYIEESLAARQSAQEAERAQLIVQRRSNRRLRILLGSVGVLLAASVVAGVVAVNARGTALDQADLARAEQVRADEQAELADQQASRAEESARDAQESARLADARRLTGESAAFDSEPQLELLTAVEAVGVERLPAAEARLLGALARSPSVIRYLSGPLPNSGSVASPGLAVFDDRRSGLVDGGAVTTWEYEGAGPATVQRWPEISDATAIVRSIAGLLVSEGSSVTVLGADAVAGNNVTLSGDVERMASSPNGVFVVVYLSTGEVALIEASESGELVVRQVVAPPSAFVASPGQPIIDAMAAAVAAADDGRFAAIGGSTVFEWDANGVALASVDTPGTGSGLAYFAGELARLVDGLMVPLAQLPAPFDPAEISGTQFEPDAPGATDEFLPTDEFAPLDVSFSFLAPQGPVVGLSPGGGERVASLFGGTSIGLVDSDDAESAGAFERVVDPGLGFLSAVSIAPDGRSALVAGDEGVALVALDGRSSLERSSIALGDAIFTGAVPPSVSPDGSRLALLSGAGLEITSQVVDLATGEPIGEPVLGRAGFLDDRTVVSGAIEPEGLVLQNIDAATGTPTGSETLIPEFSPGNVASEDAPGGRIIIEGSFGGEPDTALVFVERGPIAEWRTLDELGLFGGSDQVALRPGHDEVFAVRGGLLERVDLERRTVEPIPIAGTDLEQLAFAGDGATLFVSSGNRVLSIDVSQPELEAPTLLAALSDGVSQLTADETGSRVAAITPRGQALLDAATGEVFGLGQLSAQQVDFLPTGDLLVVDSTTARVIGLDTDRLVTIACEVAGRVQTPEEWERYGPQDAPYAPACAD